jgi:DNA-binding PadR family transcriptional regulator
MFELEDCPCSGKNLSRFVQPAILAVLARESLHGYLILERLTGERMFREQPPDPAGVYRILKGMEHEGIVSGSWELQGSGPARRRYAITDKGRACLTKWFATMTAYQGSIASLLGYMRNSLEEGGTSTAAQKP